MRANYVLFGDCRKKLQQLKEAGVAVQTCITSPPYYGLRDYGHKGQLGNEETPEEFVQNLVEVFRGVWDVLADDGTLWLNLGDSYASNNPAGTKIGGTADFDRNRPSRGQTKTLIKRLPKNLKSKNLIGIPWRVAFALQADGWYLRQDIIWSKPNAMPESVKDRCTISHEYIFLFSKSKRYYFDNEAIKVPATSNRPSGNGFKREARKSFKNLDGSLRGSNQKWDDIGGKRNKRSVWTIPVSHYKGAHFATYPPDLITPCILAGCPAGGIVLDPFFGSGTTGEVAQMLGRNWIGCEINEEYKQLQQKRTQQMGRIPPQPDNQVARRGQQ